MKPFITLLNKGKIHALISRPVVTIILIVITSVHVKAQIVVNFAGCNHCTPTMPSPGDFGPATDATINNPWGVYADHHGNVYIADTYNHRIRKVGANGIITTIAGTGVAGFSGDGAQAVTAELNYPYGTAVDDSGNIYIADAGNGRIRKIDLTGTITTIAGNGTSGFAGDGGPATAASVTPYAIAIDKNRSIYIADAENNRIRKINAAGIITTVAGNDTSGYGGDGIPATATSLWGPSDMYVDSVGNIFIADNGNMRIRKVDTHGIITTIAGDGNKDNYTPAGPALNFSIDSPTGIAIDKKGNMYISDMNSAQIYKVDSAGEVSAYAGNGRSYDEGDGGLATAASIGNIIHIALDDSDRLYITSLRISCIREILFKTPDTIHTNTTPAIDTISLLPIPNVGSFSIKGILANDTTHVRMAIFNDIGQAVYRDEEIVYGGKLNKRLDLGLPEGIYFLHIHTDKGDNKIRFTVAR